MFRAFRNSKNLPKSDSFFKTDHLEDDLKNRSVKGGVVTLASQGFKFVLQMGSTAVLARLLAPEDYGLVGMTTAATSFIQLFKDMGLSEATIQCKEINHRQISTLFWLNCAVGAAFTILTAAVSPLVANFYNEPRVIGIMCALSVNFFISSLAVQHNALLKRQMHFTTLAKATMTSMTIGVIVAILAAWQGLGYWALVLMFMATVTTDTLWAWLACQWRPGRPYLHSGIRSMLSFGGNLVGFNCVNYFSRNLDNILIGRVWGPQQLGLYSKAYNLVLLPIKQINTPATSVAMPTLSRLQDDPEKFKRYYYKAITLITMIGMPIVCFLFVAADDVILIFLGDQWLDAVPIFRLLMPAAFIGTFNVAPGWAFRSLGRTAEQFRLGIISSVIYVVIFVVSIRWGATGVAAAYGLSSPFIVLLSIIYCYKDTFLNISDLLKSLASPAINSLLSAALLSMFLQLNSNEVNVFIGVLTQCLAYLSLYILSWSITKDNRKTLREFISMAKTLKKTG